MRGHHQAAARFRARQAAGEEVRRPQPGDRRHDPHRRAPGASARHRDRSRPRPGASIHLDRCRPDQAGGHEHAGQRPARHRRQGQDHRPQPALADGEEPGTRRRAGSDGGDRDRRHRMWNSAQEPAADIRSLLHIQGSGQRNRPGPVRQPRHRQRPRRRDRGGQRGRQRDRPSGSTCRLRPQARRPRRRSTGAFNERPHTGGRRRGDRHPKLPAHSRRRRVPRSMPCTTAWRRCGRSTTSNTTCSSWTS